MNFQVEFSKWYEQTNKVKLKFDTYDEAMNFTNALLQAREVLYVEIYEFVVGSGFTELRFEGKTD